MNEFICLECGNLTLEVYCELEMFWSAFGAIGTTIGSLITAIAVVIAVIQYRQPLTKKIKISSKTSFPVYDIEVRDLLLNITIANTGVRNIFISNVYLNVGNRNLIINKLIDNCLFNDLTFSCELSPEKALDIYISYNELSIVLSECINNMKIEPNKRIKILVTDTSSGEYYHDIKATAQRMAKVHI